MKQLILIILLAFSINAYTQDDKVVKLVVNGQGKTKDEAKQNALRNAIEQAFGAFVSSKTEILNDSLVKDEIVSVANGNIQEFNIISEVQIPNGDYATSLKATVSVTKLTAFVESKGVIAEFKGNILAANVKQQILNEQNEIKSIENIVNTCKEILDASCDFELVRGEPQQKNNDNNIWSVPITINVLFNKNIEQFTQYIMNSIKGICMTPDEIIQYNKLGKKTYQMVLGNSSKTNGISDNIDFLLKNAKSNQNLYYKIFSKRTDQIVFESNNFDSIKSEFVKYKEDEYNKYQIKYYDTTKIPIYHFRNMKSIVSIIDMINYTKHSVLNFEISNGINIKKPDYLFKIIEDKLNPIFNGGNEIRNTSHPYIINEPGGLFYKPNFGELIFELYKPQENFSNVYKYQGVNSGALKKIIDLKYDFLMIVDDQIPSEMYDPYIPAGFNAVISLFDYKSDRNKVLTFYYEDILSLSEIEKVKEYKITPISKN